MPIPHTLTCMHCPQTPAKKKIPKHSWIFLRATGSKLWNHKPWATSCPHKVALGGFERFAQKPGTNCCCALAAKVQQRPVAEESRRVPQSHLSKACCLKKESKCEITKMKVSYSLQNSQHWLWGSLQVSYSHICGPVWWEKIRKWTHSFFGICLHGIGAGPAPNPNTWLPETSTKRIRRTPWKYIKTKMPGQEFRNPKCI